MIYHIFDMINYKFHIEIFHFVIYWKADYQHFIKTRILHCKEKNTADIKNAKIYKLQGMALCLIHK